MARSVLVPIGPGPNGQPVVLGRPVPVDGGGAANDVVAEAADAGVTHLVSFPTGEPEDVEPFGGADRWPAEANFGELAIAAGTGLDDRVGLACGPGSAVVLAVPALIAVGGFDPDEAGLGLLDLVDRLDRSTWSVGGVDRQAMPFVPALTAELGTAERVATEGRWLGRRTNDRAGRRRLDQYHRLVTATIEDLRAGLADGVIADATDGANDGGTDGALLDRMEAEAEARWQGLRPDQAQVGIGRRADWRHLLPPRPAEAGRALAILSGLGPAEDWRWLVDDGWADRVEDRLPEAGAATGPAAKADVIVLGPAPAVELERQLDDAVAALADGGALCLLVAGGKSPVTASRHLRLSRRLRRLGCSTVRRHVAMPDAASAKRFIPLDHPGGLGWLAGPDPALDVAALPPSRRRLRDLAGRAGGVTPHLIGDLVLVATAADPTDWPEAVVVTSGFDEGSRTVLLPFDGPDATRPTAVIKVASRPGYRANGEREHRLLQVIHPRVEPAGLVPEPLDSIEVDGLPAVVESYAGRWTATDILNEQTGLAERSALLEVLLGSVTSLNRTGLGTERWNDDGFEANIGRWFDDLDRIEGPSPSRVAFRAALGARSDQLVGHDLPVGLRHFDLGPWNLVLADTPSGGSPGAGLVEAHSPVTAVDWELAPPREVAFGPIGTDQLYLCKYWLHIAQGCRSVADEQSAFAFLAKADTGGPWTGGTTGAGDGADEPDDAEAARRVAKTAVTAMAADIGLPLGFLPLLEASVWAEAASYTARRRRGNGGDGGSPARYLATLARHRVELLDAWR